MIKLLETNNIVKFKQMKSDKFKKWIFMASCIIVIICAILTIFFSDKFKTMFYMVLALSSALTFFLLYYPHLKNKKQ